jgi:hypothetical protein
MVRKISFAFIAVFWLVMNGRLWHSEFGAGHDLGSTLPAGVVWQKILTAPDDSSLSISSRGKRLGYIRWRPNAGEDTNSVAIASENDPEGMVRQLTEYKLQIDGSVLASIIGKSVRFSAEFVFTPKLDWKRFQTDVLLKSETWQVKASALEKDLWIQLTDGDSEWIRRFTFDQLRNPKTLLAELDSPILAALLPHCLPQQVSGGNLDLGFQWEARHDWLQVGKSRMRIYRLEARLLDRHRIVVLASRVGEILKIELPGELILANDLLFPTP